MHRLGSCWTVWMWSASLVSGLVATQAQAQLYSYRYGAGLPFYGGNPNYYGYRGPGMLTNNTTVGRPGYQYGYGLSPFLWYNPRDGYFIGYNTGLPWNTPGYLNGPLLRNQGYGTSRGGVVRYSRPPQEPNETFYVRSLMDIPEPNDQGSDQLMPAVAEASEQPLASARQKPPLKTGNWNQPRPKSRPRVTSPRRYRGSSSYPSIRASGGADWVPAGF
jgi:hypothetical protein